MTGNEPEHVSVAEYRAIVAGTEKPKPSSGSARGENAWNGPRVCATCGQRVWLTGNHASFTPLTYHNDDLTGAKTVRHARKTDCRPPPGRVV